MMNSLMTSDSVRLLQKHLQSIFGQKLKMHSLSKNASAENQHDGKKGKKMSSDSRNTFFILFCFTIFPSFFLFSSLSLCLADNYLQPILNRDQIFYPINLRLPVMYTNIYLCLHKYIENAEQKRLQDERSKN